MLLTARSTSRKNRPSGGDGCAEIAVHSFPEPQAKLNGQRAIEAVSHAQLVGELLRSIGRQDRDQRIARRDVHEQEADERDAEDHGNDVDNASGSICEHESPSELVDCRHHRHVQSDDAD